MKEYLNLCKLEVWSSLVKKSFKMRKIQPCEVSILYTFVLRAVSNTLRYLFFIGHAQHKTVQNLPNSQGYTVYTFSTVYGNSQQNFVTLLDLG